MRNPIEVEAIVFRRNGSKLEFLLLKRRKEFGGFWQPLTGGNEDEESLIETLKRELREETGIEEIKRIIENVHYFEWIDNSNNLIKEYCFGVEVSPSCEVKLSKEHDDFKWCDFEEAMKLLKWDGNKVAIFRLNEILKSEKAIS
jgi:8-oxo-dGTP pyrophosphatase MutT (NUDIX family)